MTVEEQIEELEEEILAIDKQYKRLTACGVYMNGEPKEVKPLPRAIRRLEGLRNTLREGLK
jgi:hypothetical protein